MNTPLIFTLLLFISIGLVSCSTPEERLASELDKAANLLNEEPPQITEAIQILESLYQEFSNNPDIIEALAFAHSRNDDQTTAAFFYEEAARLDPERSDLFLFAASVYQNNQELGSAIALYEEYLEQNPEDLLSRKQLASLLSESNQTEPALKRWLEYFDQAGDDYAGTDAFAVGDLFESLGNNPQAQTWYKRALEKDDTASVQSLEGLLNISLSEKNWDQVKTIHDYATQYYPAVAQTENFQKGLLAWQSIQEVKEEVAKQAALPETITQTIPAEAALESSTPAEEQAGQEAVQAMETSGEQEAASVETLNQTTQTSSTTPQQKPYTNIDGSETLPIAEVDPTELPTESIEDLPDGQLIEIVEEEIAPEPVVVNDEPTADQALLARNYKEAITLYWKEIGAGQTSAGNWFGLAQAYELTGQLQQAEIALLESTRQAPEEVRYALEYLRIVYQTRTLREAFSSIERILKRFPDQPDVLLSIAKAYETIGNNQREANYYYNRFLQVAPDHEKAGKIREKLGR